MASGTLSTDEFFVKLSKLFENGHSRDEGVFLSQKKLVENSSQKANGSAEADDANMESPVLIRATNGKPKAKRPDKVKFSTVVQPNDLASFYVRYAEVCKTGMQGMKKRDRRKKGRAKKRKEGEGTKAT